MTIKSKQDIKQELDEVQFWLDTTDGVSREYKAKCARAEKRIVDLEAELKAADSE